METIELTRKELYEKIWSTPLSKLAKEYALSDNGFRKLCIRYDIPIPKNGYWSKLKFNKPFKKDKFNPIFGGIDKIVLTIRKEGSTVNLDQDPLTIRTKEIENDLNAPLIVPDEIIKPDILTIQTKQYWKGKISFASYRDDNKIIHPIRVEKSNRERALRFMDTFTKLIRYRGHTFSKEHGNTGVLIDGIFIEIDLREASKRIPPTTKYGSSEYIPTGEFIFKIGKYYHEKEWRDNKIKIENHLAKIVAKLELIAKEKNEWKENARIASLKREEEEKRLTEIQKRREEEIAKLNKLVALSEQYNKTLLIRQYIEAVKQKAINTNSLTPEKQEWINWATDKADWLDPLINKSDAILDEK